MWDIDVTSSINPKASIRHWFIIVVIDYFTKLIEVVSHASVTTWNIMRFIRRDIIAHYRVLEAVIIRKGTNLNKFGNELIEEFKI